MTTPTIRVLREDDTEVKEGDTIIDFRGKPWTFLMVTRANKIYAKDQEKNWKQEFFKDVFKLRIVTD